MGDIYVSSLNPLISCVFDDIEWENVFYVHKGDLTADIKGIIDLLTSKRKIHLLHKNDLDIKDGDTIAANIIYYTNTKKLATKKINIYPEGASSYKVFSEHWIQKFKNHYGLVPNKLFAFGKHYVHPPRRMTIGNKHLSHPKISILSHNIYQGHEYIADKLQLERLEEQSYIHLFENGNMFLKSFSTDLYVQWVHHMMKKVNGRPLYIKARKRDKLPTSIINLKNIYDNLFFIDESLSYLTAEVFIHIGITDYIGFPSTAMLAFDKNCIHLTESTSFVHNTHKRRVFKDVLKVLKLEFKTLAPDPP